MKRIFTILCALAIVMAGSATALAAEPEAGQSASYYPVSVEEYTYGDFDELRINKTYQLSLSDDPSLIPTEDFVRNGRRYYLLDMTRKDEVGVDIQTHTETVTKPSDTNSLETILQRLDAEMEVTTDGDDKPLKLRSFLLAMMLCALCVTQASALEYTFDAPEDYLFGQPTSDDTIYEWENPNVDRSKNTALIAPGFGTPTSYLPGSGEYLTPNLVPGALSGGLVNQVGSAGANATGGAAGSSVIPGQYPSVNGNVTMTQIPGGSPTDIAQGNATGGYTEVTSDLYYSNGSLGTLKIPAIGLTVKVYQGTDSAALKKGAGHFTNTSIWDGNACFAGHNRGVNNHFGKIHTLEAGDTITLTTVLGTRTYAVSSVEKVSVNDSSGTAATTDNRVTLYTCVMDQPEYRWKVTAIQQG